MVRGIGGLALAAAALLLTATPTLAAPKEIKPVASAFGEVKDRKLMNEAPKAGYINDAKTYDALVKSWKIGMAPKVDFRKQMVLVNTRIETRFVGSASITLQADGDLRPGHAALSRDVPATGFYYMFRVIPKEGVKKVNGKDVK